MTEFVLTSCVLRTQEADEAVSVAREAANPHVWRNLTDRFPHPYPRSMTCTTGSQ